MNLRIISWNVRGLNVRAKRRRVSNSLRMWNGDVVCLQETKLEVVDLAVVQSLRGSPFVDWEYQASKGASGGIVILWDKRVVEKLDSVSGEFTLSCKFRNVGDNLEWAFSGVYGPNSNSARGILWDELAGISNWWSLPWCIGGDFNVVRYPNERLKGGSLTSAMWAFTDFINELGLIDLPLIGGIIHGPVIQLAQQCLALTGFLSPQIGMVSLLPLYKASSPAPYLIIFLSY